MAKKSLKKKSQETESESDIDNSTTTGVDNSKRNSKKAKEVNELSDGQFEVEAIVATRNHKGKRQFKIRWKGCEESYDSWEYESELNCSDLMEEFLEDQSDGSKKKNQSDDNDEEEDDDQDEEYEVESIVDVKTIKGKRKFLVHWKGYGTDNDSWELEENLNCKDLINKFLSLANGKKSKDKKEKKNPAKNEKEEKGEKKEYDAGKKNSAKNVNEKEEKGEKKEYEVGRILEVQFKKNGKRNFLIRWKGFSAKDDTWEPEENLQCEEMIEEFMKKVDKVKDIPMRELREIRKATKRYHSLGQGPSKRSRRHVNEERVTYYSCEED